MTSREILRRNLPGTAEVFAERPHASLGSVAPHGVSEFFSAIKATRPSRSCCFIPTLFSALTRLPTMNVRYGVFRRLPSENRSEMSALDLIVSNVNSHYTQRRLRPFARRARSTARPPLVDMRARKPWHFARLRLFGW